MEACLNIAQKPLQIPRRLTSLLSTKENKLNSTSTLQEVLEAMKNYIYENNLYDLRKPHKVQCNQELRDALNRQEFTFLELKRILLKVILKENIETVTELRKTLQLQAAVPKRKSDEVISEDDETKRFCDISSMLPTVAFNQCCSNSVTSFEETLIKNIDEENPKIVAIEHMYDIEYDIDSDSSLDSIGSVTDTDSEIEDILKIAIERGMEDFSNSDNSEDGWNADLSSNEICYSDSDMEQEEADKYKCIKCGVVNKLPLRYCAKCWQSRKGGLSHLPKRKRKSKSKCAESSIENTIDSGLGSSMVSVSSTSSHDGQSSSSNTNSEKLCVICCSKQMNATVVHGKIGHQFSCYKCARKLLSSRKPCPYCRRSIDRVIHQIVLG